MWAISFERIVSFFINHKFTSELYVPKIQWGLKDSWETLTENKSLCIGHSLRDILVN